VARATEAGRSAAEIAKRDYELFRFAVAKDAPGLEYIAFGVRHHPAGSKAPTVYEIAHRRLHG
jgi:hypothetical protein